MHAPIWFLEISYPITTVKFAPLIHRMVTLNENGWSDRCQCNRIGGRKSG